jgi:pimeloyl-ACP methyl ester carboxylesterase
MTPTTKTDPKAPAPAPTILPRTTTELRGGEVAYVDQGAAENPVALFVHGVLVNADIWRNVIWDVADVRRCIAPDLPAHGGTPVGEASDLTFKGHAALLDQLCARLGVDQVDVVANDTGGAIAQVFAARYPQRIRTLTLTDCDVHDNFPPEPFKPFVAMAKTGDLAPLVLAMAGDLGAARSEAGYGMGYAKPAELPDELLRSYMGAFVADAGKGLERFLATPSTDELIAAEPALAQLQAPTQVAWGTDDVFFETSWAERLRDMIPGTEKVVLVPDAMLFWPDERAAELVALLRDFWDAHPD